MLELPDRVVEPLHIDIRVISKRKGHGLDDDIIDADLNSVFFLVFVEFVPEDVGGSHLDGGTDVIVRDGLLGFAEAVGDGFSHAG